MDEIIWGNPIIPGQANGHALVSDQPLSFWGGYDHQTGEIIDRRHPLSGKSAAGRILVLPFSRGSSTTTAVLLEALRSGTAPAAIITTGTDTFFALASIVAKEMFNYKLPILAINHMELPRIRSGQQIEITREGQIIITGDSNADERRPY